MNSEKRKTSDFQKLLLNLMDKTAQREVINIYYKQEVIKS